MRIVPILALAFAATLAARADVVVEQKTESPMMKGTMSMKIKGDRARMDTFTSSGNISVLMDLKTERMMILMHTQKIVMEKDMKTTREQTEAAQRAAGLDPSKIGTPKATGKTEKVGEWTTDVYEFKLGDMAGRLWVAKDFPNSQVIRDELKKVTAANAGGFDPAKLDVPGLIVKYQLNTAMGMMTSTMLRAAEEPVAETEFLIPQGYNQMAMPPISSGVPK